MDKLDLFGSQILFRFNGQPTHNTKFGSIFTLSILAVIGLRLFFIIKDVFQRNSPQVIFQERQVDDPSLFTITNDSYQLAFGMQDGNFDHYINEGVYHIRVTQREKKLFLNEDTNKYEEKWADRDVPLTKCTLENFPDPVTRAKFESLQYYNMFCFPVNEELYIEGDFSSPSYQFLRMTITQCKETATQKCADPDVIKSYLKSANFAMYFSDINVDPTKKSDPFQKLARDMFFTTSTMVPKDVNFFFRNSYIESDFGWVTEDIVTQHSAQFGHSEVNIQPSDFEDYFLELIFRFEKQKENLYQRKYKNLNSIISEIGGFTQSLLAIGFLICSRYSQLDLNKNILNEAFNFKNLSLSSPIPENDIRSPFSSMDINEQKREEDLVLKSTDRNRENSNYLNVYPCISPTSSFIQANNNNNNNNNQTQQLQQSTMNFFQSSTARGNRNNNHNISNLLNETQQQSFYYPQPLSNRNQNSQASPHSNKKIPSKIKNILNDTAVTAQGSVSIHNEKQFLSAMIQQSGLKDTPKFISPTSNDKLNILSPDHEKLKKQQQKLEEKEQKIKESMFKRLLQKTTSHMTLGVFEYLKLLIWPFGKLKEKKKVLDFGIDTLYYHLDVLYVVKKLIEVDKLKHILLDKDQLKLFEYIPKPTIISNYGHTTKDEELKIELDNQYQDTRTELQKAQQAYAAYQTILNKQSLSILDNKIVDLIDPQLLTLFGHPEQREYRENNILYQQQQMQQNGLYQVESLMSIPKLENQQTQIQMQQLNTSILNNNQNANQNSSNMQPQKNTQSTLPQQHQQQLQSQQQQQQQLSPPQQNQSSPKQQFSQTKQSKLQRETENMNGNNKSISQIDYSNQKSETNNNTNNNNNLGNMINVQQSIPISLMDNIPYSPTVKTPSQHSFSDENASDEIDHHREKANDFIVSQPYKLNQENLDHSSNIQE